MKTNLDQITRHVISVSDEARADMAANRWDEVMCDALYAACGATTRDEMSEARDTARNLAWDLQIESDARSGKLRKAYEQTEQGNAPAEHTPGPWKHSEGNRSSYIHRANDGNPVCYMAACFALPNERANAALIAAAPELLAACRAAASQDPADWQEIARAAIAKATGGAK